MIDVLPECNWPYYQKYWCKCHLCERNYFGPKLSGTCWMCATPALKDWWESKHDKDN